MQLLHDSLTTTGEYYACRLRDEVYKCWYVRSLLHYKEQICRDLKKGSGNLQVPLSTSAQRSMCTATIRADHDSSDYRQCWWFQLCCNISEVSYTQDEELAFKIKQRVQILDCDSLFKTDKIPRLFTGKNDISVLHTQHLKDVLGGIKVVSVISHLFILLIHRGAVGVLSQNAAFII